MTLGTCDLCGRLVSLTNDGRVGRHDQVGIVIRARTGKRRVVCKGSRRWPRRVEQESNAPR